MEQEIWKDIPEYDEYYQVSSFGRIRSLDRYVYHHVSGKQLIKGRILIQSFDKDGYKQVTFSRENKTKTKKVHRLVCTASHENPLNKSFVNHKDGDKTNNHKNNVEWCTPSENNKHAYSIGLRKINAKHLIAYGSKNHASKPVIQMDLNNNFIEEFCTAREADKKQE